MPFVPVNSESNSYGLAQFICVGPMGAALCEPFERFSTIYVI
jgi:hypothetical protein